MLINDFHSVPFFRIKHVTVAINTIVLLFTKQGPKGFVYRPRYFSLLDIGRGHDYHDITLELCAGYRTRLD